MRVISGNVTTFITKIQCSADIFYVIKLTLACFGTYENSISLNFWVAKLVKIYKKIGMGDHVGSLLLSFVDIFKNLFNT